MGELSSACVHVVVEILFLRPKKYSNHQFLRFIFYIVNETIFVGQPHNLTVTMLKGS